MFQINFFRISSNQCLHYKVTKEFINKTTFSSFHGLNGESRKTLDARLKTSGMTYKDFVCAVTNDRISKSFVGIRQRKEDFEGKIAG